MGPGDIIMAYYYYNYLVMVMSVSYRKEQDGR